ncbi:MAG: glutathione S-transferase [Kiritimatiellia bacterium]|jgi:glutathione S-transferase
MQPVDLYVYDVSYFSGKMQAYLQYKGVPHRVHHVTWMQLAHELAQEAGVMEVPLLRRADGDLWRDTTLMIQCLEMEHPEAPLLPHDPALAFVMQLVEAYADEGMWRPALYYRWAFAKDAELYARRFHEDFLDLPMLGVPWLRVPLRAVKRRHLIWRQRRHYLAGEGITRSNRSAVERHYLDELDDLNALLTHRDYLLGDRPSLVDFGYFASMFRHFSIDPTPACLMRERAPRVYRWVARLWCARAQDVGGGALMTWDEVATEQAFKHILSRIGRIWLPYLHANAVAVDAQRRRFDVHIEGHSWPRMPAIAFRAWGRARLIELYGDLCDADRLRVDRLLGPAGCLEPLLMQPGLCPRYPDGAELPRCTPARHLSTWDKWRLTFSGTPHHRSAG